MDSRIEAFIRWAQSTGWKVDISEVDLALPPVLTSRYESLPESYVQFLQRVALLIAPDERAWFNCVPNFAGTLKVAFAWNEWEQMSLASALTDEQRGQIRSFWDRHLPVFMSVRDDYEYYAIDLTSRSVVYGYKDFFEEPSEVAASFTDFLDLTQAGKIRQVGPLKTS